MINLILTIIITSILAVPLSLLVILKSQDYSLRASLSAMVALIIFPIITILYLCSLLLPSNKEKFIAEMCIQAQKKNAISAEDIEDFKSFLQKRNIFWDMLTNSIKRLFYVKGVMFSMFAFADVLQKEIAVHDKSMVNKAEDRESVNTLSSLNIGEYYSSNMNSSLYKKFEACSS